MKPGNIVYIEPVVTARIPQQAQLDIGVHIVGSFNDAGVSNVQQAMRYYADTTFPIYSQWYDYKEPKKFYKKPNENFYTLRNRLIAEYAKMGIGYEISNISNQAKECIKRGYVVL